MTATTTASPFDAVDWKGHWIGPELLVDPNGEIPAFAADTPIRGFSRVFFRRTIDLAAVPASAPLRLTADSRYVLDSDSRSRRD